MKTSERRSAAPPGASQRGVFTSGNYNCKHILSDSHGPTPTAEKRFVLVFSERMQEGAKNFTWVRKLGKKQTNLYSFSADLMAEADKPASPGVDVDMGMAAKEGATGNGGDSANSGTIADRVRILQLPAGVFDEHSMREAVCNQLERLAAEGVETLADFLYDGDVKLDPGVVSSFRLGQKMLAFFSAFSALFLKIAFSIFQHSCGAFSALSPVGGKFQRHSAKLPVELCREFTLSVGPCARICPCL